MASLLGTRRARALAAIAGGAAALTILVVAGTAFLNASGGTRVDSSLLADEPRTIVAGFLDRSYRAGEVARLDVWATPLRHFTVQVFHAGPEKIRTHRKDVMLGVRVGKARRLTWRSTGPHRLRIPIGRWPSGMYFARLKGPNGWVGYAPFIVRPRQLGAHRVLVVFPTNTWQAYNYRDANHDGRGDTWYADSRATVVNLQRPYLHRGVPPHFSRYDLGFIRWLAHTGKHADYVSDDDLAAVPSGRALSRAYDLIIFPGHEEYVQPHVFDLVMSFRNLGGNLAFLSANGFFYRVHVSGSWMSGLTRFRDYGRPEARLLGAQYLDWNHDRFANAQFVAAGANAAPWFFKGTGVRNGMAFGGHYGIEINARTSDSPPHTILLARIRDIFGPGRTAEMTYYETPRGARVFDAGVINFGGTAEFPVVSRMLENLWRRLAR